MAKRLKPPGKWSEEATVRFYEKHDGSVDEMIRTIEGFPYIDDPGAFAAQIADFVRGTTYWRGRQETNPDYVSDLPAELPGSVHRNPAPEFPAEPPQPYENPMATRDVFMGIVEGASKIRHKMAMEGYIFSLGAVANSLPMGDIRNQVAQAISYIEHNLTKTRRLKKTALRKIKNPSDEFPAEHPRTHANPEKKYSEADIKEASRVYQNFTGKKPEKITMGTVEAPCTLVLIGNADSVTYEVDKKGVGMARYEHRIEGGAKMWWDKDNRAIWIQGGLTLTEHGIEG